MRLVLDMQGENDGVQGNQDAVLVAEEFIKAYDLYLRKNRAYGGAWREQGWMGNLARILSKARRMKTMAWRSDAYASAEEPLDETVQDMLVLCIFFLINYDNGHRWGSE